MGVKGTSVRALVVAGTCAVLAATAPGYVGAQAPDATPRFTEADARRWLTYLSSDLLQGRQVFTEGYGLASSYVAEQLKGMNVEPLGEEGTYFQPVTRRGYRVAQESSVTVTARGQSRTFRHGDHVLFSALAGARQTQTFSRVRFVGYGLGALEDEGAGGPVRAAGEVVLFVTGTPQKLAAAGGRLSRSMASTTGRAAALVRAPVGAAAAIGFSPAAIRPAADGAPAGAGRAGRTGTARPDLTTVAPIDRRSPPVVTADAEFFDFVFGDAGGGFTALRSKSESGAALPASIVADVEITINVDARYEVISTERTQNVVGIVRGTDAVLRDSYVMFGAHLDHVGYSVGDQPRGRVNTPVTEDAIWNGADDDGSGVTAVLAIAKAFGTGPRPKRSVVFVWHAGEEDGLIGSAFMAEHPVVPLDRVQAMLNIDMIGRNRDNDASQHETLYVIGADRISTDLHNMVVDANQRSGRPLRLDYEFNDATDPNSFYTRSDHYSYASKGVPSAFFFTGTHPDYHANTDTVDKILFPKLVRITEFIYRLGFLLANREQPLELDHLGPRSGRGFSGPIRK